MGRSPCCDKIGLKKGPWTPEEDQKLLAYIDEHGHGSWRALPAKAGLQRCGKSCRLRWTNYLRPDIKRGKFSLQEEQTIIQLHALLGNRWAAIATHLPKRTDNEIKNYWNTHLKKRLTKMGIDPVTHKPKNDTLLSNDGQTKNAANLSHMAQWESARLEAEARLVRQSKLRLAQTPKNDTFENNNNNNNKVVGPALSWNGGVTMHSPTSTLSSGGNGVRGYGTEWVSDVGVNNSCEQVSVGSFNVENYTDLLLSASSGERTLTSEEGVGDTENGSGNSGGDNDIGGCYEDNKNYWNSILNLVNSSPSHSPLF